MRADRVLVGIISLGLVVVSASFAQDMSEFQQQMMQRMMQQTREKVQTKQSQPPGFVSVETGTQGKALFNDTSLGTNGKSCGSCHQEGQGPLDGRQADDHLVASVQYCYGNALAGQKVIEKDKLNKIMGYFNSLQKSQPSKPIQTPYQEEEESW